MKKSNLKIKINYNAPKIIQIGKVVSETKTNQGGNGTDGGTNPYHKS